MPVEQDIHRRHFAVVAGRVGKETQVETVEGDVLGVGVAHTLVTSNCGHIGVNDQLDLVARGVGE